MRTARASEVAMIANAVTRAGIMEWPVDTTLEGRHVGIIDDYISDGPGFAGKVALIVWGEPQFITALGFEPDENLWRVLDVEPVN